MSLSFLEQVLLGLMAGGMLLITAWVTHRLAMRKLAKELAVQREMYERKLRDERENDQIRSAEQSQREELERQARNSDAVKEELLRPGDPGRELRLLSQMRQRDEWSVYERYHRLERPAADSFIELFQGLAVRAGKARLYLILLILESLVLVILIVLRLLQIL